MKINMHYGQRFECNTVKNVLDQIEWYQKRGYNVKLPKGITKKSTDEEIRKQIEKEFESKAFESMSKEILYKFDKVKIQFEQKLKEIFSSNLPVTIEMYLTQYGTGGSYSLPNKIILNPKSVEDGVKGIVHETIHLLIEKDIEQYKIPHFHKERIVDLILNARGFEFLNYNEWQESYNGAERIIDPLFKKLFFKNKQTFFKTLKKVLNKLDNT